MKKDFSYLMLATAAAMGCDIAPQEREMLIKFLRGETELAD